MRYFVLFPVFLVILAGFGCGQKARDAAIEAAINQDLEGKATYSNETITFEGDDGETVSIGENVVLPDDFPKDIPVYPNSSTTAYSLAAEGAWLTLSVNDDDAKILDWYAVQFSGWEKTIDVNYGGAVTRSYMKDNIQMTISVLSEGETHTITILRQ